MFTHVRANLCLLVLTLLLCCVLYPLVLWGAGRAFFAAQADGSLIADPDGKPVGSRLIAQSFNGDEWFQPRPSAASYNAAASGASNWGASNPLLRDRVARQLGPLVKYAGGPKKGQVVGPDVEAWFREKPDRASAWAKDHPTLAGAWVKSDDLLKTYVTKWTAEHPDVELEQVPADAVMASGSGLDPHVTLRNARWQLDRVVAARSATEADRPGVRQRAEALLEAAAFTPLGGLAGAEPLVNVLEVNLALERELPRPAR